MNQTDTQKVLFCTCDFLYMFGSWILVGPGRVKLSDESLESWTLTVLSTIVSKHSNIVTCLQILCLLCAVFSSQPLSHVWHSVTAWTVVHTPGCSVHGILQARILGWIAISFSRGSSRPGTEPRSPALQADSLPLVLAGKHEYQIQYGQRCFQCY